jgi:coenzyme F420-0:L-glutamate ligase / coenzyme F420-1:gamma-L-glutamate ligase
VSDAAFWGVIRGRRSVRRYLAQPVPVELVEKLLQAAHWAPSAHNRQPWRFVLLNDPALRRQLAEAMAASWQADLLADGADAGEVSRRAAISIERITTAPLAILPCLDGDSLDSYPDPQRQQREWQMGVQSVALACQNLLLAAHQHGLAACWMCAPIFCPALVQTILDLPASLEPQALLTIGYPPDDAPRNKERAPLATRVLVR